MKSILEIVWRNGLKGGESRLSIDSDALSPPTDHRISVNHVQGLSPRGPDSGMLQPKHPVALLQPRDSLPSLQHCQLLPQSQILKGQVTALLKSCHNQNSQPSHRLKHGLECGGDRLNNQWLSC